MSEQQPWPAVDQAALDSLECKFHLVRDFVQAVARGYKNGLFLYGRGGEGKSFAVIRHLETLDVPYQLFNSRMTAKGLFMALEHAPDAIHVLEDMERLTRDPDAQGVLRSALWAQPGHDRKITWTTATEGSRQFVFRGGIIMIASPSRPTSSRSAAAAACEPPRQGGAVRARRPPSSRRSPRAESGGRRLFPTREECSMATPSENELAQQLFAARGGNNKDAGPEAKAEQERLVQALFHGPQPGQEGARADAPGHEAGGEQLAAVKLPGETWVEFVLRQRQQEGGGSGGSGGGNPPEILRILPEGPGNDNDKGRGGR
jgi:hypothetical protein